MTVQSNVIPFLLLFFRYTASDATGSNATGCIRPKTVRSTSTISNNCPPTTPSGGTCTITCQTGYVAYGRVFTCRNRVWLQEPQCKQNCKRTAKGKEYMGTIDHDQDGNLCRRWDSQWPNTNPYKVGQFPDINLADAANYCRNPSGLLSRPGCYLDDKTGFGFCNIPTCDIPCTSEPPQVANAEVSTCISPAANGKTCNVKCLTGYALSGGGTLKCTSGTWTIPSPGCMLKSCPKPSSNGVGVSSNNCRLETYSGRNCSITCIKGYKAKGNYACDKGVWKDPLPTCKPKPCRRPPYTDIDHSSGHTCKSRTSSGRSCGVTCGTGYTPSGMFQCDKGEWTKPLPTCDESPCPKPTLPSFASGTMCATSTTSGGSCELTCLSGYTASGPYRCDKGTWNTPYCYESGCSRPDSTKVTGSTGNTCADETHSGQTCRVTCGPGYLFQGWYMCRKGQWTSPLPHCQECSTETFGRHCRGICHCKLNDNCHHVDGSCVGGCADGYGSTNCSIELPYLQYKPFISGSRTDKILPVSWGQCVSPTSGARVSGYTVMYRVNGTQKWTAINIDDPGIHHQQLSGLKLNTYYSIAVRCRTTVTGAQPKTSPILTAQTCSFPNKGKSPNPNDGSQRHTHNKWKVDIYVHIDAPAPEEINCDATRSVKIYYKKTGASESQAVTENRHTFFYSWLRFLDPYTYYSIQVTYINNAGLEGPKSDALPVLTLEGRPGAPDRFRINSKSYNHIWMQWSKPTTPNGVIINYEVLWTNQTSDNNFKVLPGNTTNYKLTDVIANTVYHLKVRGKTVEGFGNWSNIIKTSTIEEVPGVPESFHNVSRSHSTIQFTWSQPINVNGYLKNYTISCVLTGRSSSRPRVCVYEHKVGHKTCGPTVTDTETVCTCEVTGLEAGRAYTCDIVAATGAGCGGAANMTVWTIAEAPPIPEVIMGPSVVTDTSITIKLPLLTAPSYLVVVDKINVTSYKVKRSVNYGLPSHIDQLYNFNMSRRHNLDYYVAATFQDGDIKDGQFMVGDGVWYGQYYNAPLITGEAYNVWLGAAITVDGETVTSYSNVVSELTVSSPVQETDDGSVAVTVIPVIFGILLVGAVIAGAVLYRKRKLKSNKRGPRRTDRPVESEMEKLRDSVHSDKGDDKASDAIYENTEIIVPPQDTGLYQPITMDELVDVMFGKFANDKEGLRKEYKSLPDGAVLPCVEASQPYNQPKNRYKNILPYDDTRVKLLPGGGDGDYINADFIDGYNVPEKYIASQGPRPQTVTDFWRMIWDHDCPIIVMVTRCSENGRDKCATYWPMSGSKSSGDITINLEHEDNEIEFIVRTFQVKREGSGHTKKVQQFHYQVWPDHGVPHYGTSLLNFRNVIRRKDADLTGRGPTVVHCSAGVGRTGTYIAIDYLLDEAADTGTINVYRLLHKLRRQRQQMIQSVSQYYFVHDAILEALVCGKTTIPCSSFSIVYRELLMVNKHNGKTKIQEQFEILQIMCPEINVDDCKGATDLENISKNRDQHIIPSNRGRPYLTTPIAAGSDYINAVFVDGFKRKDVYIVSQLPLPNTVADFWRLIYDQDIQTIIMLNSIDSNDQAYWPDSCTDHGCLHVKLSTTVDCSGYVVRDLQVNNTKKKETPINVKQFHFKEWDNPQRSTRILNMMGDIQKWQQSTGDKKILIHCLDGVQMSGVFVAVMSLIDKIKIEQEVDVFQMVKVIRSNRPQFIVDVDQYRFCYEMGEAYMDSFDIYDNFK